MRCCRACRKVPVRIDVDRDGKKTTFYTYGRRSPLEQASQQPDDEAAGDAGKPVDKCWQSYVDQVLVSVAECPAAERDITGLAVYHDDGEVSAILQLTKDGDELLKGDVSDLSGTDLRKELFVSVEWLNEFKHLLLSGIQPYETLLALHMLLLLLSVLAVVTAIVARA